jgi:hypothetical protein
MAEPLPRNLDDATDEGPAVTPSRHGMRRVSMSLVSVPEGDSRKLNLHAIEGMAVALLLDQPLPPVELLMRSDGHFELSDGRQRFVAHLIAGRSHIDAEIVGRVSER